MFTTSEIATAICRSCNKKEQLRLQALLLVKSVLMFEKDIGARIFLLLYRAPWHKSKKALEFFQKNKYWLQILFFPPATPDRNPREYCWKSTKRRLNVNKIIQKH